ncbi:hypothetical protein BaRGS_00031920 [Batillaria attramentaria]|uniref:Uncharacterized protein n=1 Tax=Batillaria attramentaria TaxID=370345 RepID=A0ABD0JPT3_9CAEN
MEAKIGQNSKDVADIPTAEERVVGYNYAEEKQNSTTVAPGPSGRSVQPAYEPQIHCLLCGTPADVHNRRKLPKGHEAFQVKTTVQGSFQAILRVCDERNHK